MHEVVANTVVFTCPAMNSPTTTRWDRPSFHIDVDELARRSVWMRRITSRRSIHPREPVHPVPHNTRCTVEPSPRCSKPPQLRRCRNRTIRAPLPASEHTADAHTHLSPQPPPPPLPSATHPLPTPTPPPHPTNTPHHHPPTHPPTPQTRDRTARISSPMPLRTVGPDAARSRHVRLAQRRAPCGRRDSAEVWQYCEAFGALSHESTVTDPA